LEHTSKLPGAGNNVGGSQGDYNSVGLVTGGMEDSHETEMSTFRGGSNVIGEIATQRSIFNATGGGSANRGFQGTLRNQAPTSRKLFPNAKSLDRQHIDELGSDDEEEIPSSAF